MWTCCVFPIPHPILWREPPDRSKYMPQTLLLFVILPTELYNLFLTSTFHRQTHTSPSVPLRFSLELITCLLVVFARRQTEFRKTKLKNLFKKGVQKTFIIFEAILPLFQGNMVYFLSIVVDEYLCL